jgi:integrase
MFYLIGINTKDLLLAKKNQVIDGRLEYVREKTGKKYSVKIEPEAERLIQTYFGKGDYLLDAMDHCQLYRSFQHQINDAIKLIGDEIKDTEPEDGNLFAKEKEVVRIEPVIPGISTYFARHCWATFAYEIGISTDVISQALGHSFGHRTTFIYIKPDQGKVDTANRKVIDYLLG